jgi:hypothetical protein
MQARRNQAKDQGSAAVSGGAVSTRLAFSLDQLVFNVQFEFLQANFFELLIFGEPGLLQQCFQLFRIVAMLRFQAIYFLTIRLTVRFQIHKRHLRFGIGLPAEPAYCFAGRIHTTLTPGCATFNLFLGGNPPLPRNLGNLPAQHHGILLRIGVVSRPPSLLREPQPPV